MRCVNISCLRAGPDQEILSRKSVVSKRTSLFVRPVCASHSGIMCCRDFLSWHWIYLYWGCPMEGGMAGRRTPSTRKAERKLGGRRAERKLRRRREVREE